MAVASWPNCWAFLRKTSVEMLSNAGLFGLLLMVAAASVAVSLDGAAKAWSSTAMGF